MHSYLSEHPRVFVPAFKEPHFFSPDLRPDFSVSDIEDYHRLFTPAQLQHEAVGEASVWYLHSSEAASRIHGYNPDSRIIVMVRDPVSMFVSLHNQLVATIHEDVTDAEQAWRLQVDRARGRSVPRCCEQPQMLQYGAVCRLGEQLERWMGVFPRNQIHVIVFDDIVRDTAAEYKRTLSFLGLADDDRTGFPRINVAHQARWPLLGKWHRLVDRRLRTDPGLQQIRRGLRPLRHATRLFRRANVKVSAKREIDASFRRELTEYFAEDIDRLASSLNRDLSHWKRSAAEARPS